MNVNYFMPFGVDGNLQQCGINMPIGRVLHYNAKDNAPREYFEAATFIKAIGFANPGA